MPSLSQPAKVLSAVNLNKNTTAAWDQEEGVTRSTYWRIKTWGVKTIWESKSVDAQNLVSIKFFYGQDFSRVESQNPFLVRIVCWVIIFLELYWKNSRCNFWWDQLSFGDNILQGSENFGVKTFLGRNVFILNIMGVRYWGQSKVSRVTQNWSAIFFRLKKKS